MKIALRANANQRIVCADAQGADPLIANRDGVGAWEEFEMLTQDEHGNWVPFVLPTTPVSPPPVVVPQPPTLPPYSTWNGSPKDWFGQVVYGKPFGQQTLLDVEPTLNQNGWLLTPPNAVGERTKVNYPNGPWVRVGFGEGHWVWVVQS